MKLALLTTLLMVVSGCVQCDRLSEAFETQPLLIFLETGARRIDHKPGFEVLMTVEAGKRMSAPSGDAFLRALEGQMTLDEANLGRKFCENGYDFYSDATYNGIRSILARCKD